jgi:hypothetical protein
MKRARWSMGAAEAQAQLVTSRHGTAPAPRKRTAKERSAQARERSVTAYLSEQGLPREPLHDEHGSSGNREERVGDYVDQGACSMPEAFAHWAQFAERCGLDLSKYQGRQTEGNHS